LPLALFWILYWLVCRRLRLRRIKKPNGENHTFSEGFSFLSIFWKAFLGFGCSQSENVRHLHFVVLCCFAFATMMLATTASSPRFIWYRLMAFC
jgi:hypothetical protein